MKPETQAIHTGSTIDPSTGAVASPIHLSTTFERDADGSYPHGYSYIRDGNPNREVLEASVCGLENGAAAAAFASGSVAMMSVLQALTPQDHVIAPDNLYYGIRKIMIDIFGAWGMETTFVDMTNLDTVNAAVRPNTKLVIVETPSNPLINITDIRAVADIAHNVGAYLLCDNTIASPILQQPLSLGADFVVHATTKWLGGHSDVMAGVVITREENELWQRLVMIQKIGGAIASPFDCWLTMRGIQTLPLRMRLHAENALKIAQFLHNHSAVECVLYPGLESHPGHEIAKRQMSGYSGLMSFLVKGDEQRAMQVAAKVKLFIRATSFGGVHSLIEHRASIEGPESSTPRNLLRISVGLEHVDDLIADLDQALG